MIYYHTCESLKNRIEYVYMFMMDSWILQSLQRHRDKIINNFCILKLMNERSNYVTDCLHCLNCELFVIDITLYPITFLVQTLLLMNIKFSFSLFHIYVKLMENIIYRPTVYSLRELHSNESLRS